jgi:oxygen-dependent protoporphyrinogen oxidase
VVDHSAPVRKSKLEGRNCIMKIAIIGGGIAGLSAVWELEKRRRAGEPIEYRLFERSPRLGGVIQTEKLADGSIVESGPDSFLTEKPWAAALCRELGLADQLIGSNDATRQTFILVRNKLRPLPDGLHFFVPARIVPIAASALFSTATKLRFAREYLLPPKAANVEDESVAAFVERHFGREVVDRLADPLLGGIYGGRADQLSVRAVLPRMVQMEAEHGSLVRAMLRSRKKPRPAAGPLFTTLRDGMQQMTDAVAAQLNAAWLHTSVSVTAVQLRNQEWRVHTPEQAGTFDAIVLALPAWAAAGILRGASSDLAAELTAIPYSNSITVNLAFSAERLSAPPKGFGFLVPRSEGRRMLACTFVQNKFPHRAPPGRLLFRCFFAATNEDQQLLNLRDDELSAIALRELREIVGIAASPDAVGIARWHRAMAQYSPGHLARVAQIERLVSRLPGLALAGNFLRGIGVPDCVRAGAEAANSLVTALQPRSGAGV